MNNNDAKQQIKITTAAALRDKRKGEAKQNDTECTTLAPAKTKYELSVLYLPDHRRISNVVLGLRSW